MWTTACKWGRIVAGRRQEQGLQVAVERANSTEVKDVASPDVNALKLEPADKPGRVWIVLWVFLALTLALVATLLGLGPYVSRLLVSILAGGEVRGWLSGSR